MKSPNIAWLSSDDPPEAFPDIETAFDVPDGLLAAGGDLSTERLLYAYLHGIFPWYDQGQPILWWSPDPRCVLVPEELHVSRRLRRSLAGSNFEVSFNSVFSDVMHACSQRRKAHQGTWITDAVKHAYELLHAKGWAHSIEIWHGDKLVGGLYGLSIGRIFFGESMFSAASNGSKAAMFVLCQLMIRHDFVLLDCQVESPHLVSLGAKHMPRPEFAACLAQACEPPTRFPEWPLDRRLVAEFLD